MQQNLTHLKMTASTWLDIAKLDLLKIPASTWLDRAKIDSLKNGHEHLTWWSKIWLAQKWPQVLDSIKCQTWLPQKLTWIFYSMKQNVTRFKIPVRFAQMFIPSTKYISKTNRTVFTSPFLLNFTLFNFFWKLLWNKTNKCFQASNHRCVWDN